MIDINELRVSRSGRAICAVDQLAVSEGERVAIVGPNGCGKTTLLRVLAGLETEYDGRCVVEATTNDRVYVHQAPFLFRGTVLFNVTYGLRERSIGRTECERLALHWLERFGLRGVANDRINHLSGGERRRVALARAMVLKPRLLLLDEPLADMDEAGAAAVADALDDSDGCTVLIASPTTLPNGLTTREYSLEAG